MLPEESFQYLKMGSDKTIEMLPIGVYIPERFQTNFPEFDSVRAGIEYVWGRGNVHLFVANETNSQEIGVLDRKAISKQELTEIALRDILGNDRFLGIFLAGYIANNGSKGSQ